jgi:starvation-inducible DNA-binding protein
MSKQIPSSRAAKAPVTSARAASFTVPTLSQRQGSEVAADLQQCLENLLELSLTLRHIHWNVVGPNFIGVHEMLDPQYNAVQLMCDQLAERIAQLGSVPIGIPSRFVTGVDREGYQLDRADSLAHLGALDLVYSDVVAQHRQAIGSSGDVDVISQDLLIGQTGDLEKFQWFVRSHLADWAGGMANAGATNELSAAKAVAAKQTKRGVRQSRHDLRRSQ